jgi:hypothetical protein
VTKIRTLLIVIGWSISANAFAETAMLTCIVDSTRATGKSDTLFGAAHPTTPLLCVDGVSKKGQQTNLKELYAKGWTLVQVVPVPESKNHFYFLDK